MFVSRHPVFPLFPPGSDRLPAGGEAGPGESEEGPGEADQDAGVRPQTGEVSTHTSVVLLLHTGETQLSSGAGLAAALLTRHPQDRTSSFRGPLQV